jgi:hypothetical protein
MIAVFAVLLRISVIVSPVAGMLAVGLSFTLREIAGPLRHPDKVFRALVANFVLVPLLAFGIARLLGLAPSFAAGLMLVGTAAGAPFLLKLTLAARRDLSRDERERANMRYREPDRFKALRAAYFEWDATMPAFPENATYDLVYRDDTMARSSG